MNTDWHALFALTISPLELIVRGSAIYWFLFLLFRFLLRRDVGALGVPDVLLLVLVADASQNAMAGEYRSISDGCVLVSTIVAWNQALDWLSFRFRWARHWIEPPAVPLIRNGRILHRNLRREFISQDELRAQLREHGVDDVSQVRTAHLESDGAVSIVQRDRASTESRGANRTGAG